MCLYSPLFYQVLFYGDFSFILERSYFRENLIIMAISVGIFVTFGPIIADYIKKYFPKQGKDEIL